MNGVYLKDEKFTLIIIKSAGILENTKFTPLKKKHRIMGPKTFRDPNKKNTKNMSIAPQKTTPQVHRFAMFWDPRDESAPKPIPQVDWDLWKMEEGNRKRVALVQITSRDIYIPKYLSLKKH